MCIFAKIRAKQVFVEKNRFSEAEICHFTRQKRQTILLGYSYLTHVMSLKGTSHIVSNVSPENFVHH